MIDEIEVGDKIRVIDEIGVGDKIGVIDEIELGDKIGVIDEIEVGCEIGGDGYIWLWWLFMFLVVMHGYRGNAWL